jgi:hypothetical protein
VVEVRLPFGTSDLSTLVPLAFFIPSLSFSSFCRSLTFMLAHFCFHHGRSRHTIPVNRDMTQVPSAQPSAMKNPHTNQTNSALAEITGTIWQSSL